LFARLKSPQNAASWNPFLIARHRQREDRGQSSSTPPTKLNRGLEQQDPIGYFCMVILLPCTYNNHIAGFTDLSRQKNILRCVLPSWDWLTNAEATLFLKERDCLVNNIEARPTHDDPALLLLLHQAGAN
jgi:hypothetical protein